MNTERRLFGVFALVFLLLGVMALVAVNGAIHGKGNEMIAEVRAINEKIEAPTPLPTPTPVNLDAVWRSIEDLAVWKSNYETLSQKVEWSEQEVKRLEERTWVLEAFLFAPYQMPPVGAKYLGPGEKLYPWTEYSAIALDLFWSPYEPVHVDVWWWEDTPPT